MAEWVVVALTMHPADNTTNGMPADYKELRRKGSTDAASLSAVPEGILGPHVTLAQGPRGPRSSVYKPPTMYITNCACIIV
jgi:hypothetical protein